MLTPEQKRDLRALRTLGFTEAELAEYFETSTSTVSRALATQTQQDRLDAIKAEHKRIQHERWLANPRFAGFDGDSALFAAAIFDEPTDGGNAFEDGDGRPR